MRIGTNPLADVTLPPMPGIVLAVITHLPSKDGYHAQRFDVIQACMDSMRSHAGKDYPLYVWDNGSAAWFRDWLVRGLNPDYLTLSPNIGKASARTAILRAFPSQTVICLADDDILFSPGWLEPQLELLTGFPNVGVVSGCPIRTQFRWATESTLKWARENAVVVKGRYIPDEWEYDFCRSIGRDYLEHLEDTANEVDYLIQYKGLKAYATAHHMQFIGYAGRLGAIGLWPNRAMRVEKTWDTAIDNLGLLRLTTIDRYVQHMGNVLEKELA